MNTISYYEKKVNGYVFTDNLTSDRMWEIFQRLAKLGEEELLLAKEFYQGHNNKLSFMSDEYGLIELIDNGVN